MAENDEEQDDKSVQEGAVFDVEDDAEVVETEDGGAIVRLDEEEPAGESEFYANLAETLPESDLGSIATTLLDLIDRDKEARKRRDEQYEEGLRRTGLGDDAPGGAQFSGASRVVHPMMTEVCVDFAARAIKELFPPSGPAKDFIPGKTPKPQVIEKAQRKTEYLNWQMTTQMPEFRAELEQLLTQLPLGGGQYLKLCWEPRRKRPAALFVAIDDVLLPFAATNFYSAERKTHVQYLTELAYQQRVASGMYRDVDLDAPSQEPDPTSAERANNKIEGREPTSYNEDGLRTIYEVSCTWEIEEGVGPAPYLVTIDKTSRSVLSIYRNWEEPDEAREELVWIVEFAFVPWRGAYPIGIPQMIGGLSAAATGALRALLDSAHINNFPGVLKLKGGAGGQTDRIDPTEMREIEGGLLADDIRKLTMPLPFNPPSATLFQLLGFLVDAGKGVIRTTLEETSDNNPNVPVGTTLARIEQGMVVFSAIHARLHDAMKRVLSVLHRLNKMYLEDGEVVEDTGQPMVKRVDFEGPMDVVPVSDPNIFSEQQRFAQIQAVAQRAQLRPDLYDGRKVEEMILERLKLPNALDLLVKPPAPTEQNAVTENVMTAVGRPIAAFPDQDHLAHLKIHLDFMSSPVLGQMPAIAPAALPALINHLKEHVSLWYANHLLDVASDAAQQDVTKLMHATDNAAKRAFDQLMAAASARAMPAIAEALKAVPSVVQQAIATMQAMAPKPVDPTAQTMQAQIAQRGQEAQMRNQTEQAKAQASAAVEQAKLAQEAQSDERRAQLEAARIQQQSQEAQLREDREDARTEMEVTARVGMNNADNQTAKELAAAEIMSGERVAVSTGTGINPGTR